MAQPPRPNAVIDYADDWQVVYKGTGWLGGHQRPLTCWSGSHGYRIHVAGMGEFAIDPEGRCIEQIDAAAGASPDLAVELLLGPVLTVALALRSVWCLHASAVVVNGGAVAFLGDSGAGKSTLAGYLGLQNHSGWQRIADDVLPVELGKESAVALPHFPQLKLPVNEQVGEDCPQRLPLEAIYVIEASDHAVGVSWHPLDNKMATLALLSHTVAARLFDANLLRRHLSFCVEVAACVPVRRLVYPHRLESLSAVQTLLEQWLQP